MASNLEWEELSRYNPPTAAEGADSLTRLGQNVYREEAYRHSLDALRIKNQKERKDQQDRELYSERAFLLAINWIVVVMLILVADGCVTIDDYFEISDSVMVTLIGATTATVLGLFAFVMKYLFHRQKE